MRKNIRRMAAVMMSAALLAGCGGSSNGTAEATKSAEETTAASDSIETTGASDGAETTAASDTGEAAADIADAPAIDGLTCTGQMELDYATAFDVYEYDGGYSLIRIQDEGDFLVVPEDADVPENLDEDTTVLQQPLDNIYLAATSAMSLFAEMDGVGNIKFSSLEKSGWYVDAAVEAMDAGEMTYAGKYSEPDYEMLVDQGCDLAIESTMIYHSPKVQEMIEMLDIPVLIDRSSYESDPRGRVEWIKMYSALIGKEDEADAFFDKQIASLSNIDTEKSSGKSVVYFYITTDGMISIRNPEDYISKMIEMGGGVNPFADLAGTTDGATIELTMEEFYATASEADYLIYNGSIDNTVQSIADLEAKNDLFKDFKAVKDDNVWTSGKALYQSTDIVTDLILDVNNMIAGGSDDQMTFLTRLQ